MTTIGIAMFVAGAMTLRIAALEPDSEVPMASASAKIWDMLKLIRHGGPAICNVAVTNSCNATCDFCNFANGKVARKDLRWIDAEQFPAALDILHRRGIRYLNIFGGEPLLHPKLMEMLAAAVEKNMGPAMITNGWLLPAKLDQLAQTGLKNVYISIDSPVIEEHEANRGLKGVCERIKAATSRMPALGITPVAQVAMSRLVKDYGELVPLLRDLGFSAVTFSYTQRARLGSSSLAWSSDSKLVNFSDVELANEFDEIDHLRKLFPVNNPSASIADMKRHLRREPERFVCYGGYKSFYMDWNFDIWRCDAWGEPMCSVWEFENTPLIRDGCTGCIADCYRDSSVMLHFAVSLGDAMDRLAEGRVIAAFKLLATRRNLESILAVAENAPVLSHLARVG
jgi:MoaA/NifB/PqqE/SkfB family radical SAM enzyme